VVLDEDDDEDGMYREIVSILSFWILCIDSEDDDDDDGLYR
jgi:hypothetical protein